MTCLSCAHVRAGLSCAKHITRGFPAIGSRCPLFIYEPGSDEADAT